MPQPSSSPIGYGPAKLGLLSWACVLASAIFPPLILLGVAVAHCAWWGWLSGRAQRGFGWALSAMIGAHGVLAFWWILLGAIAAGPWGVAVNTAYLLLFFASIAFALHSAAAKYLVVGMLLTSVSLGLFCCWALDQRELARRIQVHANLRQLSAELATSEFRRTEMSSVPIESSETADWEGCVPLAEMFHSVEAELGGEVASDSYPADDRPPQAGN
jgi:hypothetical protein